MCRPDTHTGSRLTTGRPLRLAVLAVISAALCLAQTDAATGSLWKRVAGTTIANGLAAPAGGPVRAVWFAPGDSRLLVETASGRIFETSDYEHWRLNTTDAAPARAGLTPLNGLNDRIAAVQPAGNRLYAAGASNIFSTDDNGRTWLNLTGFNGRSVIGGGFNALAVSGSDSRVLVAANQSGVWRSLDGGLTWHGLNNDLPALSVRRLAARRTAQLADGSRIAVEAGSWVPVEGADPEAALIAKLAPTLGTGITAAAQSGQMVYVAVSGRLTVSRDGGATWGNFAAAQGVTRLWIDPERTDSALAVAGSRLLRTINAGLFWDDVTGQLPETAIHGVTADPAAGIVYIATDRGVFNASLSLNDAGPAPSSWRLVSATLPAAPAWDVRLNDDLTLTVALDGYGVFETAAPHQARTVRIVNGADLSMRPAAPGSLISVLGANIAKGSAGALSFPVLANSEQTSQLQVPFESTAGSYQIALEGAGNRWTVPLTIRSVSPAIFVDSEGAPLILDSLSGLVLDPNTAIHAGTTVQLLATGLGKVTPDWPTGVAAPLDAPPTVAGRVTAFLDGSAVEVVRATLAPGYIGYYVIELRIPRVVNRGAAELRVLVNGEESNAVRVYLESDLARQ